MTSRELLVKRIGLVAITNLIIVLGNLVLLPILTRNLSISEYGIWVQIVVTIGLVPAIALLGLPFAMVRFLPSAKNANEVREIFYSISLVIIVAGFLASFLIFLWSILRFSLEGQNVFLLSFIVFIECLITIPSNYFRATQQIKKHSAFLITKTILNVSFVAYFVLSGSGIYGAMFGFLISSFIILFTMSSLVIHELGFTLPTFRDLREYLAFGVPTVPGSLSGWIVNYSDRYVIGLFLGAAAVGYYSPAYTLGNIITVFIMPFAFILPAVLAKHYDENEVERVKSVLDFSMKCFLSLAIPSWFGLSLLSEPILTVLSTSEIAESGHFVTPFLALSAIFYGTQSIYVQVIILEKKTILTSWIMFIAAFLSLSLNFALIPYIGILGAAFSNSLAFAFTLAVTAYYANKSFRYHLDRGFLLKSIAASLIMSLLIIVLSPSGIEALVVTTGAACVLYFIALYFLKAVKNEDIIALRNLLR